MDNVTREGGEKERERGGREGERRVREGDGGRRNREREKMRPLSLRVFGTSAKRIIG